MIALETVLGQDYTIRKGDMHAADDPLVAKHAKYFIAADTPTPEIRARQAELLEDSAVGAFEYPPPPPPMKMRATRNFNAELITSTHQEVKEGEEFQSDSDVFLTYAKWFEPADQPTKRRK